MYRVIAAWNLDAVPGWNHSQDDIVNLISRDVPDVTVELIGKPSRSKRSIAGGRAIAIVTGDAENLREQVEQLLTGMVPHYQPSVSA